MLCNLLTMMRLSSVVSAWVYACNHRVYVSVCHVRVQLLQRISLSRMYKRQEAAVSFQNTMAIPRHTRSCCSLDMFCWTCLRSRRSHPATRQLLSSLPDRPRVASRFLYILVQRNASQHCQGEDDRQVRRTSRRHSNDVQ